MNDVRGLILELLYKHKRLHVNRVCRARFFNENGYIRDGNGLYYNYRNLSSWSYICGYKYRCQGTFELSKNY